MFHRKKGTEKKTKKGQASTTNFDKESPSEKPRKNIFGFNKKNKSKSEKPKEATNSAGSKPESETYILSSSKSKNVPHLRVIIPSNLNETAENYQKEIVEALQKEVEEGNEKVKAAKAKNEEILAEIMAKKEEIKAKNEEMMNNFLSSHSLEDIEKLLLIEINKLDNMPEIMICIGAVIDSSLKESNPAEYIKKCGPLINQFKSNAIPKSIEGMEFYLKIYTKKYEQSSNIDPDIIERHEKLMILSEKFIKINQAINATDDWIVRTLSEEKLSHIYEQISSIANDSDIQKIKQEISNLNYSIANFHFALSDLNRGIDEIVKKDVKICIKQINDIPLKKSNNSDYIKRCNHNLNRCNQPSYLNLITAFQLMYEVYTNKHPAVFINDAFSENHQTFTKTAELLDRFKEVKSRYENEQGIKHDAPKQTLSL